MSVYSPDPAEFDAAIAATQTMHERERHDAIREAEERERRRFRQFVWARCEDGAHEVAAVKAIAKRLCRLEDRFGPADREPRVSSRVVLRRADRIPGLEGAACWRTLLPDGTVSKGVVLGRSSNGRAVTEEDLDAWVASFPIDEEGQGIRLEAIASVMNAGTNAFAEALCDP